LNDIFIDTEKLEDSNNDFDSQCSNDDSSLSSDDGQDITHIIQEPTKLLATKSINPKDKIANIPPYPNNVFSIDQIILGFNAHIPIWGGQFTFQKKKLNVTNT
jgi:hypothetical protein